MLQTLNAVNHTGLSAPFINRHGELWNKTDQYKRGVPPRSSCRDLSTVYPNAIATSSDALGWQHIRAIHLQHDLNELNAPASDSHCIMLNLGALLFVSARSGKRNFEGELRAGEIAIVPAGSSWSCTSGGPHQRNLLLLYLRPIFVRDAVTNFGFAYRDVTLTPLIGISHKQIRHIAMSLLHELNEANVTGRLYADSLAAGLAMQVVRRYSTLNDVHIGHGGIAPHKLRKALCLIDRHLTEETEGRVALRFISQQIGMSYFHLSRTFKQSMGMSLTTYIAERRINHAKRLLEETELPISEIALRLGFSSQSHFTTAFRKLAGATPKAFRASI